VRRLAGFTNQKPARRTGGGYAPWVRILHAHPGLAPKRGRFLLESARNLWRHAGRSPGGSLCKAVEMALCCKQWCWQEPAPAVG
jgi:hypothetical protein